MYYYQRLRDLREDADKTQKEIAELLNTNQSQYQKYESGKRELPLHHAITPVSYTHLKQIQARY